VEAAIVVQKIVDQIRQQQRLQQKQQLLQNKLIYCITPSTSNPYFGTVQTACKEEGEKLGYKVKCVSHDDDATKQSELFDTAISEGASAIVCDNAGADASIEAVQKAYDAGIPTFMVDREINKEGLCVSQIVANNDQGAQAAAEALSGADNTGGAKYFHAGTSGSGTVIGSQIFY